MRYLVATLLGSINSKQQALSSSVSSLLYPNSDRSQLTSTDLQTPTNSINHNLSRTTGKFEMNKMSAHTRGLIDFINMSPSPFHAVHNAREFLSSNGFRELNETESWKLQPMDRIFLRKNSSTLFAAAIGGKFRPGNGFHLIGAHTDSPCLRLKPLSEKSKEGYIQLGVETYGGGLWYTWYDRELKVAGRAVMSDASGRLVEQLVHVDRPIACVPSLAIHLNREVAVQGFNPNTEQHLVPILCTSLMDQLNTNGDEHTTATVACGSTGIDATVVNGDITGKRRHPTGLLRAFAEQLGLSDTDEEPLELELYLCDYEPARVGGLYEEFIHAPRLDNLFNSYASLHGLVESLDGLSEETCVRVVCLYDHEEVGSVSTHGANSSLTKSVLKRIADALASNKHVLNQLDASSDVISVSHLEESLSKSFLLSADQAHAVHPSYADRHEVNHKPQLHSGVVLKYNCKQSYTTNALTAAVVRQIARLADVPVQEFVTRQDVPCGSTIGPMLSSQLGIASADVGFPQLAMHSCRELCCTTSITQAVRLYATFFEHMHNVWPPA